MNLGFWKRHPATPATKQPKTAQNVARVATVAGAGRTIRIARPHFGTEGLHGKERNPPSFQQPALITAHADVVGSLLRPSELLRAQEERAAGRMTPTAFKEIEDSAVDWAVRLQEEAGLEVVTDGEMRRLSFQSQMTEAVRGFGSWDLDAFLWGEWHGVEGAEDWRRERPANLGVVGKLVRQRQLAAENVS